MVIKVMKWPLRQFTSKKYQVNVVLNRLEGLSIAETSKEQHEETKLFVDLKWKGPKGALGSRFRSMKREKTNALPVEDSGCITWNQEFEHVCLLTSDRLGVFQPWHVYLVLCKVHYLSIYAVLFRWLEYDNRHYSSGMNTSSCCAA